MFIERLLNQGNAPLLEQVVRFSAARQKLILENAANVGNPNYLQKDLSLDRFQQMLQERADARRLAPPGSVTFQDITSEIEEPTANILFHDRSNQSMEQLMAGNAKNALFHNMMIELLKKQLKSVESALQERVT
jgi:flagellar basal body rod protein FlgB